MNVLVFDSHSEASQVWQELASAHGFRVSVFHNPERLPGLASEAQILVIDQSVLPQAFLASIATICKQHPSLQVIATGASLRVDDAVDLMRDGVALVFPKPLSRSRILSALPPIFQKVDQIAKLDQEYQRLNGLFSKLTTREKDVLNYILVGTSNKDTAGLLNVSVRTIESRRAKVYRKLEANNVAELVRKIDRLESLGKQVAGQPPIPARPEHVQPRTNNNNNNNNSHLPFNAPHRQTASVLKHQVC